VDVAFDGGEENPAGVLARRVSVIIYQCAWGPTPRRCGSGARRLATLAAAAGASLRLLLRFHERLEIRDRALHRARALDHLRQKHLAGAEQVADRLHPVHQRTFDHVSGGRVSALLGILLDEVARRG
jgi:hypothetical protein